MLDIVLFTEHYKVFCSINSKIPIYI